MLALAQMNIIPGNPEANLTNILRLIEQAKIAGHDGIVFPEMALPGYLLGDEWENDSFIQECVLMNEEIIAATRGKFTAIWGNVSIDETRKNEDGRTRKYNSAFIASDGKLISNGIFNGFTHKTLMPKYRLFDDERHFHSLAKLAAELGKNIEDMYEPFEMLIDGIKRKVGIIICEDMWDTDYPIKPVDILKSKGAEIIINLSTSPFGIGKSVRREGLMSRHSEGIDFYYANATGTQNNGKNLFLFDGGSAIFRDGKKIASAPDFTETLVTETSGILEHTKEMETILQGIITGFTSAFEATKAKKFVIGLSGGVDSALVTAIAVLALGREKVVAINMPSKYNSETTKGFAREMAEKLGIEYRVIGIQESVELTKRQLQEAFSEPSSFVLENIQARDRGSRVLAGVAATIGGVFSNNGNKTETALGYATLYGDVNGFLAPIADLYKTQVYELCRHINATRGEMIPEGILTIVPSAELSSEQNVDEGKGDPIQYEYHDKLLFQLVEMRRDPEYILEKFSEGKLEQLLGIEKKIVCHSREGGNPEKMDPRVKPEDDTTCFFPYKETFIKDIERIYSLLKINFFKRVQAPPILTLSKRAFGFDLREAQNGVYYTRKYRELKEKILNS